MPELYFKDSTDNVYTDADLMMIVLSKEVPDFVRQTLIQDEIPYTNQKVTYMRKNENRIITLTVMFDVADFTELNEKVSQLQDILSSTFTVGFYDEGFEYECNMVGEIKQSDLKKHLKIYTFTFETTTPDRVAL